MSEHVTGVIKHLVFLPFASFIPWPTPPASLFFSLPFPCWNSQSELWRETTGLQLVFGTWADGCWLPPFPIPGWKEERSMLIALRVEVALSEMGECGAGGGAERVSAVEGQSPSDHQETSNLSVPRLEFGNVHVMINQASGAVDPILSLVSP